MRDVHEEPRLHTLEVKDEDRVLANLFNNELDQLLLFINFMQMRSHILQLVGELKILTEKLQDIAHGLAQNSTPGTH